MLKYDYYNAPIEADSAKVRWKETGPEGKMKVRDLWEHQDMGEFSDYFETIVKPHQCVVARIFRE